MENKSWDKEYSTQFLKEVDFLADNGIRYVFVKTFNEVRTYKYAKNEKLFSTLARFYLENKDKK